MPRARKAVANAPAVPDVPTGQPYGMAQEQRAAIRDVPLPTGGRPPAPGPGAQDPVNQAVAPAGDMPETTDPMTAALAAAPPEGNLRAPGDPNIPITAGMPFGPGPGPEVLAYGGKAPGHVGPATTTLRQLAELTGSPVLARLAAQAEQRGV